MDILTNIQMLRNDVSANDLFVQSSHRNVAGGIIKRLTDRKLAKRSDLTK